MGPNIFARKVQSDFEGVFECRFSTLRAMEKGQLAITVVKGLVHNSYCNLYLEFAPFKLLLSIGHTNTLRYKSIESEL